MNWWTTPIATAPRWLGGHRHRAGRHGAPADGEAHIELTVRRLNGHYVICVRDHGPGLPESGEFTPGFGLTITELLAQQLRATLSFEAAEPGVRAVLKLPVEA